MAISWPEGHEKTKPNKPNFKTKATTQGVELKLDVCFPFLASDHDGVVNRMADALGLNGQEWI